MYTFFRFANTLLKADETEIPCIITDIFRDM